METATTSEIVEPSIDLVGETILSNVENGSPRRAEVGVGLGASCSGMCVSCPFAMQGLCPTSLVQEKLEQTKPNGAESLPILDNFLVHNPAELQQNKPVSEVAMIITSDSYVDDLDLQPSSDGDRWKAMFDDAISKEPLPKQPVPQTKSAEEPVNQQLDLKIEPLGEQVETVETLDVKVLAKDTQIVEPKTATETETYSNDAELQIKEVQQIKVVEATSADLSQSPQPEEQIVILPNESELEEDSIVNQRLELEESVIMSPDKPEVDEPIAMLVLEPKLERTAEDHPTDLVTKEIDDSPNVELFTIAEEASDDNAAELFMAVPELSPAQRFISVQANFLPTEEQKLSTTLKSDPTDIELDEIADDIVEITEAMGIESESKQFESEPEQLRAPEMFLGLLTICHDPESEIQSEEAEKMETEVASEVDVLGDDIIIEQNAVIINTRIAPDDEEYTMTIKRGAGSMQDDVKPTKIIVTKKTATATRRTTSRIVKKVADYRKLIVTMGQRVTKALYCEILAT